MGKLLAANWKLNPTTTREALKLAKASDQKGVLICPPFPFLSTVKSNLKRAKLCAQDAFWENRGAYTGEISPEALKRIGITHVIIGHSERRKYLKETDEMINQKVKAVLKTNLKIILCVGEPYSIRRKGFAAAKRFVASQLKKDLAGVSKKQRAGIIIAYEPIWAIGTGKSDNPPETAEMSAFIKNFLAAKPYTLNPRVLYGGSTNSKNIKDFLKHKEIDGALVGGASIKAEEFKKMIRIASRS